MTVTFRNTLSSAVEWRAYSAGDTTYGRALKGGSIPAYEERNWDANNDAYDPGSSFDRNVGFQLSIKLVTGLEIVKPNQAELFHVNDVLFVGAEDNGQHKVRLYQEATLEVTSPTAGLNLDQSRVGKEDSLTAQLDLRDRRFGNYHVDELEAFFYFRYAGQSEAEIPTPATSLTQGSAVQIVRFGLNFRFPKPGPVEITCRIKFPVDKRRAAAWVPANVTDTGSRTISVNFANPLPGSIPTAYPAIASIIRCSLVTSAQDYFFSLQYRFAMVGKSNPALAWFNTTATAVTSNATTREWPCALTIDANAAPGRYSLMVRDIDAFGQENFRSYAFELRDVTAPEIVISEPRDGQVYVTNDPAALVIHARGTVRDAQTSVDAASAVWTIGGAPQAVSLLGADWNTQLQPGTYGVYDLRVTARDRASPTPNTALAVRRFEVASAYLPTTLEEQLGPQNYLRELLRFIRSHLAKDNNTSPAPVTSQDLQTHFFQPFERLAQTGALESVEIASDVLVPVRMLRTHEHLGQEINLDGAVTLASEAALIGRWNFAELANGATDGPIDRFRGFGAFRLIGDYETDIGARALGPSAVALTGLPGTPEENTFRSTGTSRVLIGKPGGAKGLNERWTAGSLELGRGNRDFSLSLWIRPDDSGAGGWRGVLFKGSETGAASSFRRTPGIWLHPSENRVHFRISTSADLNDGGDSAALLSIGTWTHLAYIKHGRRLRLYLNGLLDQEVVLKSADILSTPDPIYLGANPHYAGFIGAVSEFRIYAVALGDAEVRHLSLDRLSGLPNVGQLSLDDTATVVHRYCNAAYDELLHGLGSSREEISTISGMSVAERKALESRLGLAALPWSSNPSLDALVPHSPADALQFEQFLVASFGLPFTFWPSSTQSLGGTPLVLQHRQASLEQAYVSQDADPMRWPDLDPDLVDWEELDPAAEAWRQLHITRSGELAAKFRALTNPSFTGKDMITEVYRQSGELAKLQNLVRDDAAGLPIQDRVAAFSLDLPMLRQLVPWLTPSNRPFSTEQRTNLAHLLVEIWKRRTRRADWVREEAALPSRPWPSVSGPGAWVPGRYKRNLLQWRGNIRRRLALEDRLGARHRAFSELELAHSRLLLDVQRATLPKLRDELLGIGDLPALTPRLRALQQHLLIDLTTAGSLNLSAVVQATSSLQVLINGIRRNWFGTGHPAQTWEPLDLARFDAQWDGIDSIGRYRTSVLNYLYLENSLYPQLRQANSTAFNDCLRLLRAIQPLTVEALEDATKPYALAVSKLDPKDIERRFFVPIAEGLALQGTGQMKLALERYGKVLNVSASSAQRRLVEPVASEPVAQPATVLFGALDWATSLQDPHERASRPVGQRVGCQNPYTRFVLFQILHCTLTMAESYLAGGMPDERSLARSLFLEAQDISELDELVDVPPISGGQAYLPNPLLQAYRARADSALRKIRLGLSALGTPLPPDAIRGGAAGLSSLVRSTPYSYRILIDRAKQLAGMAQQFEAQYLAAIERKEAELEKLMQQGFALDLTAQTVELRRIGIQEAATGLALTVLQEGRTRIEQDRLEYWLATGDNVYERQQIASMTAATDWRQAVNTYETTASALQAAAAGASLFDAIGAKLAMGVAAAAATASVGVFRGLAIGQEALAELSSIHAARERRNEELTLRRDLLGQDGLISSQSVRLAGDRLAIARQEVLIAEAQATQAQQVMSFLRHKFTNAEFYDWLSGVLMETYGFFIQLAGSAFNQAEEERAFVRQELPRRVARADYFRLASSDGSQDRRGISGSTRLLQDLYALDQEDFTSERRRLNMTQSFSAARLMPAELEAFRRTGVLVFSTPMLWFDEVFPGQYGRWVERLSVSFAALISPSVSIRATLSNTGLSRVVTGDPGYPTMVIRQDPQSVALTSPTAATGVFEPDIQPTLRPPFQGGVDTSWILEVPPAANPLLDYESFMDLILTIDYTALFSADLRERVIKTLPHETMGDRVISVRRDLPDVWYEIANAQATSIQIQFPVNRQMFPPGVKELVIRDIALSALTKMGLPCAFAVIPSTKRGTAITAGPIVAATAGIVSSRQSRASVWRIPAQTSSAALLPSAIDSEWRFEITDDPASGMAPDTSFLAQLREGSVTDIIIVLGFSGRRPAWSTF